MLVVLAPASNRHLTTAATLEAELGIADSMEALRLDSVIGRASSIIVSYCGRPFALETYAETFRTHLHGALTLSRRPPLISTVVDAGASLTPDDWELDADGRLSLASGRCWGALAGGSVVVTYQGGYTLPGAAGVAGIEPLPGDVEQACLTLCAALYRGGSRDPLLRSETTEGVGSSSWIATADMGALPPQAVALLAPYRRIVV